jgi:hypothetical protein
MRWPLLASIYLQGACVVLLAPTQAVLPAIFNPGTRDVLAITVRVVSAQGLSGTCNDLMKIQGQRAPKLCTELPMSTARSAPCPL